MSKTKINKKNPVLAVAKTETFNKCSIHMVCPLVRHRPWRRRIHANELQVNTK